MFALFQPVHANIDSEILNQKNQLEAIKQEKSQKEILLENLSNEQQTIQQSIDNIQGEIDKKQEEISKLFGEINELSETISKREEQIKSQAKLLQRTDSTNLFFEILFSSEPVVEKLSMIGQMFSMVDSSISILDKQNKDLALLEEKTKTIEGSLKTQEELILSLNQSRLDLEDKEILQRKTLIELELEQQSTELSISDLENKKAELENKKAEIVRLEQEQKLLEQRKQEELKRQEEAKQKEEEAARLVESLRQEESRNQTTTTQTTEKLVVETPKQVETKPKAPKVETPKVKSGKVKSGNYAQPVKGGWVTSPYGPRANPFGNGPMEFHKGVDLVNGNPTAPIHSIEEGQVVFAGFMGGAGNAVIIRHTSGYFGHYYHLSSIGVSVGQRVSKNQVVGKMGSTGRSTGPHLHFGLSRGYFSNYIDPMTVL